MMPPQPLIILWDVLEHTVHPDNSVKGGAFTRNSLPGGVLYIAPERGATRRYSVPSRVGGSMGLRHPLAVPWIRRAASPYWFTYASFMRLAAPPIN